VLFIILYILLQILLDHTHCSCDVIAGFGRQTLSILSLEHHFCRPTVDRNRIYTKEKRTSKRLTDDCWGHRHKANYLIKDTNCVIISRLWRAIQYMDRRWPRVNIWKYN